MTKLHARVQAMRDGVAKLLPPGSSLWVEGRSVSQAELLKQFDGSLVLFEAEASSRLAFAQAQATLSADRAAIHQLLLNLASGLRTLFGRGSVQLLSFGVAPQGKRRPQSQETRTLAVAKRLATRRARGTRGKVQKLAITAVPGPSLLILQPVVVAGAADAGVSAAVGVATRPAAAPGK